MSITFSLNCDIMNSSTYVFSCSSSKVFGSVMTSLTDREVLVEIFSVEFCGFGFEFGNTGKIEACRLAIAVGAIVCVAGIVFVILDIIGHSHLAKEKTTRLLLLFGMVAMLVIAVLALATGIYLSYLWGAKTDTDVFETKLKVSAIITIALSYASTITAVRRCLSLDVSALIVT